MKSVKESVIEKEIFLWLDAGGFFPVKYENKPSFGSSSGKAFFNGAMKRYGISDLIFFCGGKTVFCEIKKPEILKKIENNMEAVHNFVVPEFPKTKEGKVEKKKFLTKNSDIKRYKDQLNFLNQVRARGQVGFFAVSIDDIKNQVMLLHHLKDIKLSKKEIEFFSLVF